MADGKGRTAQDPKDKALYALGVGERKLAKTIAKIDALLAQVDVLRADREAQAVEVAYLAKHPLLADLTEDLGAVTPP